MLPEAYIYLYPRNKSFKSLLIGVLIQHPKDCFYVDTDLKASIEEITDFVKKLRDSGINSFYATLSDSLSVLPRITFEVKLVFTDDPREIYHNILEVVNLNIN